MKCFDLLTTIRFEVSYNYKKVGEVYYSQTTETYLIHSMATQTITCERTASTIELEPRPPGTGYVIDRNDSHNINTPVNGNVNGHEDIRENLPPPSTAANVVQQWNHPRSNMWRVFAAFFSMVVSGLNDASYGVHDMSTLTRS